MGSHMKDEDTTLELISEDFASEDILVESENCETKSETESDARVITEKDFIQRLISVYKEHRNLWDPKHPDYTKKDVRLRTLHKVTRILKEYDPNYTVEEFKRKINIIRTNYNKERHRVRRARARGDSSRQPGLWYFGELQFLAPAVFQREHRFAGDSGDTRAPAGDSEPEPEEPASHASHAGHTVREGVARGARVRRRAEGGGREAAEAEVIGRYWASKLRRLAPAQRHYAEKIINDILFEGAMGNLTRSGVCLMKSSSDDER